MEAMLKKRTIEAIEGLSENKIKSVIDEYMNDKDA